ncbi:MAG: tetratricopeptide repeat-containing serine protease family protein [Burkholderiales bacterium]
MRYFVLISLMLFSFSASALPEVEMEFYNRVARSVVKIEAHNTNGRASFGSGVVIAEGVVATNCHVTRYAKSIEVIKGGLHIKADEQISDVENDICILKVQGMTAPVVNVAKAKTRLGQEVVALGYVAGLGPRISAGKITSLYEHRGSRVIESTAVFTSGASGGGLFDRQGNLLGLVTFLRHGKEAPQHFSVPADWIYQAMQNLSAKPVAPLEGEAPFWQKSAANQPLFLRAATLRADGQSESLRSVSQSWVNEDSNNADAWFMLGTAHQELGQSDDAIQAYRKAIANDLDHCGAWYGLGLTYMRVHNANESESVLRVLKSLDEKLADKLVHEKTQNCFENGDDVTC